LYEASLNWDSSIKEFCQISVSIATRLRVGRPGLNSRLGQWWECFSLPPRPDRLWGVPSLLSNGYRRLLLWG